VGAVPFSVQPAAETHWARCGRCGNAVAFGAPACPYCGQPSQVIAPAKSKTAAILLAIFLGPWTWLYTYRRDSTKFWIGMLVPVAWIVLLILAATAFATSVTSCAPVVNPNGQVVTSTGCGVAAGGFGLLGIVDVIAAVLYPGLWIWSVVDSAVKPDGFYTLYPNG
jgi:hypothetical protein